MVLVSNVITLHKTSRIENNVKHTKENVKTTSATASQHVITMSV